MGAWAHGGNGPRATPLLCSGERCRQQQGPGLGLGLGFGLGFLGKAGLPQQLAEQFVMQVGTSPVARVDQGERAGQGKALWAP